MSYRHPPDVEALLRSLVEVVCPPGVVEFALVDDVIEHSHLTMGAQAPSIRIAFTMGMRTYDLGAIARYGRPARFLALETRREYFARWWHSRFSLFQTFAKSVKGMLCLGYYEMPRVHEAIGYTPKQWVEKAKTRRLSLYQDAIARHDDALRTPDPLPQGHFQVTANESVRDAS